MLVLFKVTLLIMLGTFAIGMAIAFITNELGAIFIKLSAAKEKNKLKKVQ